MFSIKFFNSYRFLCALFFLKKNSFLLLHLVSFRLLYLASFHLLHRVSFHLLHLASFHLFHRASSRLLHLVSFHLLHLASFRLLHLTSSRLLSSPLTSSHLFHDGGRQLHVGLHSQKRTALQVSTVSSIAKSVVNNFSSH